MVIQCVKVQAPKDAEFKKESRIGKAPIKVPAGVTIKLESDLLEVKVGCPPQHRLRSTALHDTLYGGNIASLCVIWTCKCRSEPLLPLINAEGLSPFAGSKGPTLLSHPIYG